MKKKITMIAVLMILVSQIVLIVCHDNAFDLKKNGKALMVRSEMLMKNVMSFDENRVLQEMAPNKLNNFYFRFDDHIKDAIVGDRAISQKKLTVEAPFCFEFEGTDTLSFTSNQDNAVVKGGALKIRHKKAVLIESEPIRDINPRDIGEIYIRLKLKAGRQFSIGWYIDDSLINRLNLHTFVADDKFHTYRIDANNFFTNIWRRERLSEDIFEWKLVIFPSEVPDDFAEVDYIRLISKKHKYGEEIYGNAYEIINNEMRKVLYMSPPLDLEFSMDLPATQVFLSGGLGVLNPENPAQFSIVLKNSLYEKEIVKININEKRAWRDFKIDVSAFAGSKTRIVFKASCEKDNVVFCSNPIVYALPRERYNVIILLEDALRADHLSCYGYPRKTSAYKEKLMAESVLFQNAFSQATKTRPSCPTIMTSLYPSATGVWHFDEVLAGSYLTLAEIMRNQGFSTLSIIQNQMAGPGAGLHQGFCSLYNKNKIGERINDIYDSRLMDWIGANKDRNMFIYLHVADPHGPYNPPSPYDKWYHENSSGHTGVSRNAFLDPEWVQSPTLEGRRARYDGTIAYNDHHIGLFVQQLKGLNLFDNTHFIFISDHGEYLGEHGQWGHHPPGFRQGIHVPLIMTYPKKLPCGKKIANPVQLIDIMPTVLELAQIDTAGLLLQGDSLLSLIEGKNEDAWESRFIISEEVIEKKSKSDKSVWASVIYKNRHMINSKSFSRIGVLPSFCYSRVYDYMGDPEEKSYLNSLYFDLLFKYRMNNMMKCFQENSSEIWKTLGAGSEQVVEYNPEDIDKLRSLGYLQ